MPRDENQKNVHEFLTRHFQANESFRLNELEAVTDWTGSTFPTYLSKQYKDLVIPDPGDREKHRVSMAFLKYLNWEQFQGLVTQVRTSSRNYERSSFEIVRVFEFFMPLRNESLLRSALDSLFFSDSVKARLKTLEQRGLRSNFPTQPQESDDQYISRAVDWIGRKFGGYSIYHVNGRFRARNLETRVEVATNHYGYLVDETTAVTRFIFPCSDQSDADLVEYFFNALFVETIIEVVDGEDEIWMVETGYKNKLHIWRVQR